jgi:hypothetical protein
VVSTRASFGTLDLTDFYLGTPLPAPQYIKIYVNSYPPAVLTRIGLDAFIKHDASDKPYIFFRIEKTMCGLKEAGSKLSNLRLVDLLASFGFFETTTPVLVIDDFV